MINYILNILAERRYRKLADEHEARRKRVEHIISQIKDEGLVKKAATPPVRAPKPPSHTRRYTPTSAASVGRTEAYRAPDNYFPPVFVVDTTPSTFGSTDGWSGGGGESGGGGSSSSWDDSSSSSDSSGSSSDW